MNPINLNKKNLFLLQTEIGQNKLVAFIGKEQRGYVFMTKTGEEFVIEHTSNFQNLECIEKVKDNVYTRFITLDQEHAYGINKCEEFNCYYKNDPTGSCPSCYKWERDDNENGYYLEVKI